MPSQDANIIESRHGVIHRFEFDRGLQKEDIEDVLATVLILIETLVDHLELDRSMQIRRESDRRPSRLRPDPKPLSARNDMTAAKS